MDPQLLTDHILNLQISASLGGGSEILQVSSGPSAELKANSKEALKKSRKNLESYLLSHPGIVMLLQAMNDPLAGGTGVNEGIAKRGEWTTHSAFTQPEQWAGWEMVVPAPKYNFWKIRNGLEAAILPLNVMVCEFDESRGQKRSLEALWQMCLEDGATPFCAVPSMTPGNYHLWFILPEPHWTSHRGVRAPDHWGADMKYNPRVKAWNPVHRDIYPNRLGEYTHWNPVVWDGEIPLTQVEIFKNSPQKPQDALRSSKKTIGDLTPTQDTERRTGQGERLTDQELEDKLRYTTEGRWLALQPYLWRHCARAENEKGTALSLKEIQEIAHRGNQLFPRPMAANRVDQLAKWQHRHPFNKLQANRRKVTSDQVTEMMDKLTLLQIMYSGWSKHRKGFLERWGKPECHPDYERYRDTSLWLTKVKNRGTYEHLAFLEDVTPQTIKNYVKRYKERIEGSK